MKTFYAKAAVIALLALQITAIAAAQTTCSTSITLSTQAEVDAFPTNYGCSELAGSLTITGTDISNVDGLHAITRINGDLRIKDNPSLTNINGLSSLTYVGSASPFEAGISVTNNGQLANLDGLQNLKEIAGALRILNNGGLSNIDGLSSLTSVGAPFPENMSISVSGNPSLTNLGGLRSLTTLPGSLGITDNDALHTLAGLNALTEVFHGVVISGNQTLTSLQGLNALHNLTTWLSITDNPSLTSIDGMDSFTGVSGGPDATIWVINNASLQNVDGFSKMTALGPAGHLKVTDNHNLTNGCGLYPLLSTWHLETMEVEIHDNGAGVTQEGILATCGTPQPACSGNITLTSQSAVSTFPSQYGCTEISGTLTISGDNIWNLNGLHAIIRIDGDLKVNNNPSLFNLNGLSSLTYVGAGEGGPYYGLSVTNNQSLSNVDGLENLTEIKGMLKIENNASLSNIEGLRSLISIGAPFPTGFSVSIGGNPSLTSLAGLRSMTVLNGSLLLTDNDALQDLTGLDAITKVEGRDGAQVHISGNQALSSLQGLNALHSIGGRGATLKIEDNPSITNVDALAAFTSMSGTPDAILRIVNNASLQNVNGLSNFASLGPAGEITVTDNHALTNGCGLFTILNSGRVAQSKINISNNGPGVTREEILATCRPPAICSGGITLSTQAEVDAFPTAHGCSEIDGSLTVTGVDITNLDGLLSVARISGNLMIVDNPNLLRITGLSSLTYVGGSGYDSNYPGLWITNNAKLLTLDGLEKLTAIGGLMKIENNASLRHVDALSAVTSVKGPFPSGISVSIIDNPALESILGLRSLTEIPGGLYINNNEALQNLVGLDKVASVGGLENARLQIIGNQSLTSLQGLNVLRSVSGRNAFVEIDDNPKLLNVDGLVSLIGISGAPYAGMSISNNAMLQNLDGLSHLMSIDAEGNILVNDNPNLTNGCGLYPLLSNGEQAPSEVNIYNNGPGVTREGILATCGPQNPAPQPTAMVFSNVTDEGLTVSFTAASPEPRGYITLMRAWGSPYPKDVPADGTEYHVGNVIGSSTIVVGIGSQLSLEIVYLEPNTPYYFDVFSYGEGFDYVTDNPLAGNQRTEMPPFEQPVNLRFSAVTENSMTVAFDAPAHAPQGYITLMRAYGSPAPADNPVNGTTYHVGDVLGSSTIVVGYGSGTQHEIVYLEPSTPYYYDVFSYRVGASGPEYQLNNPLAGNQRTLDPQPAAYPNPFTETLSIPFVVSEENTNVQVAIFDTMGNPVVELANKSFGTGKHSIEWNRSAADGSRVAEGLYVYRVKIGGAKGTKGLIVAK